MEEKRLQRLADHAGANIIFWMKKEATILEDKDKERSNNTRRHFICCKVEHVITVVALGLSFTVCNFLRSMTRTCDV